MFSVRVDKDDDIIDVTLKYDSPTVRFEFDPENPHALPSPIGDSGEFRGTNSNGEFHFSWSPESITFVSARYGDGEGGSLSITVTNTADTMASLKKALEGWSASLTD